VEQPLAIAVANPMLVDICGLALPVAAPIYPRWLKAANLLQSLIDWKYEIAPDRNRRNDAYS
jgi:hypothetical protein